MNRLLAAVFGCVLACNARADFSVGYATLTIESAGPDASTLVSVRSNSPFGCLDFTVHPAADIAARRITVALVDIDVFVDPCPAPRQAPRTDPVGRLAAGTYAVDYVECPFGAMPPSPACVLLGSESLVVQASAASPVGATSSVSLAALAVLSWLAVRRRFPADDARARL